MGNEVSVSFALFRRPPDDRVMCLPKWACHPVTRKFETFIYLLLVTNIVSTPPIFHFSHWYSNQGKFSPLSNPKNLKIWKYIYSFYLYNNKRNYYSYSWDFSGTFAGTLERTLPLVNTFPILTKYDPLGLGGHIL